MEKATGMNKRAPILFFGKQSYLILGIVIVILVALFIYGNLTWRTTNAKIKYLPEDVVYGEKIQAVHISGLMTKPQLYSMVSKNSNENPQMLISETFYDFGEVNSQQILTRTFIIANDGPTPLIIQRAYSTCGCTTANFTANEIPSGKVVLMTLLFDTSYHNQRGITVRRGVIIETNDPQHPIQEIWIQAKIR